MMNVYDPARGSRVYRHTDQWAVPIQTTRTMAQLPSGYANRSAATRLTVR
jgi:hypothetical protein